MKQQFDEIPGDPLLAERGSVTRGLCTGRNGGCRFCHTASTTADSRRRTDGFIDTRTTAAAYSNSDANSRSYAGD